MTEHEQIMAAALSKLQRPVKRAGIAGFMGCRECGRGWAVDEAEWHFPTCATGIARAARVACGLEPC